MLVKKFVLSLPVLGILLFGCAAQAAPLQAGGAIPGISAQDQHEVAYTFTNGTAFLLIALDMDGAKAANQELAKQGPGFLEKHGAAYLMDIHTMPGIGRFFALPKMRKYPQRIVLIDTPDALNWTPSKPGCVTVLALKPDGHVQKITYWHPASEPATGLFK
jgi:hypothetical protein